jgi:hypothetical protein
LRLQFVRSNSISSTGWLYTRMKIMTFLQLSCDFLTYLISQGNKFLKLKYYVLKSDVMYPDTRFQALRIQVLNPSSWSKAILSSIEDAD